MASILDSLMGSLSGDVIGNISKKVGIPESAAKSAIPMVTSLLTGALAKNASKKQGAEALTGALSKDHDGSILDNLPGFINNYKEGPGSGILKHVLGGQQKTVQKGLSKSTGLNTKAVGSLLTMLAPIVMGAVGKVQSKKKLDAAGVTDYLGKEQKKIQKKAPKSASFLSGLLDSNKDGKVIDDLGKMGTDLLGGFLKK